MTVKSYYGDKAVLSASVRYTITSNNGWTQTVNRRTAAQMSNDPELPVGWTIERTVTQSYVQGCPWCGARPVLWEMDCDGMYPTGTCGSEQCNQLKRCEGCGEDGAAYIGSMRGHLCETCDYTAREGGLQAAGDKYELVPFGQ
jgi:hypothetical protein